MQHYIEIESVFLGTLTRIWIIYVALSWVGELLMRFGDAASHSSRAIFPPHFLKIVVVVISSVPPLPHFLKIVVVVISSVPPHALKLWLWANKCMLSVKYIRSNNASCLRQSNFMAIIILSQG